MAKKKTRKSLKNHQSALPFAENVHKAKIKVVGVGGGGGNIVSEISSRVQRLEFVSANTDSQALKALPKKVKSFSFGQDLTGGLGCGMDADLGEQAAKAEKEKIKRLLEGSDVCILIATLGGGTGSGAVVAFAEIAQELRILCIGIFTMPFAFEGDRRKHIAQSALEKIKPLVNAYVMIPNEHIFRVIDQKTPFRESLSALNKRLAATLEGFMDTIALPGLINIDFADVRSVLEGKGRLAYMNSAEATGVAKAPEVTQAVLTNPLYEYTIKGADRMLFNVTGDRNLKMQEVAALSAAIAEYNPKARIIFGVACNKRTKDRLKITLFAVGCDEQEERRETAKKGKKKKKGKKTQEDSSPNAAKEERNGKEEKKPGDTRRTGSQQGNGMGEKHQKGKRSGRKRRSALEVKKAVDQEMQELEEKEREWDLPAFLRNR